MKKKAICLFVLLFALLGSCVVFAEVSQDTVKIVQSKLNEMGYDCGVVDGIAGQQTIEAVQKYQADNGLEITGEIDEVLLSNLGIREINIPGISASTFVNRYNTAIAEYNEIAERDGYTKAQTLPNLSNGADGIKPDGERAGSIQLNSGKNNDYDKVGSFAIYCSTDGWYDRELLTGQIISCIYAFDESLYNFSDAGNLYSQLMESNTDYLTNGDIKFHNGSIFGFIYISGWISGFQEAIGELSEGEETEEIEETELNYVIPEGMINKPEDMAAFFSTLGKDVTAFEKIMGIHLDDFPSQKNEQTTLYTIDKKELFEYTCTFEIVVLNSNHTINGMSITFEKLLDETDYEKITDYISKGLGFEGETYGSIGYGLISAEWETDNGSVSFIWSKDQQSTMHITW